MLHKCSIREEPCSAIKLTSGRHIAVSASVSTLEREMIGNSAYLIAPYEKTGVLVCRGLKFTVASRCTPVRQCVLPLTDFSACLEV